MERFSLLSPQNDSMPVKARQTMKQLGLSEGCSSDSAEYRINAAAQISALVSTPARSTSVEVNTSFSSRDSDSGIASEDSATFEPGDADNVPEAEIEAQVQEEVREAQRNRGAHRPRVPKSIRMRGGGHKRRRLE